MTQKSKAEHELERITAERDHWRRLAQQRGEEIAGLREEIADLRRQLERHGIYARRLLLGLSGDNAEIERIQAERDQARAAYHNLLGIIQQAYNAAVEKLRLANTYYERIATYTEKLMTQGEQLQLVIALWNIWYTVDDEAIKAYHELDVPLLSAGINPDAGQHPNAYQSPRETFVLALRYREIAALRWLGIVTLWQAFSLSNDPALICDHISRQLRTQGKVNLTLLEKLGSAWFQQAVPGAPAKLNTIKEQLELGAAFQRSGQTMFAFARGQNVAERTVKRALRLWNAVEQESRALPPAIREALDQAENNLP